MYYLRTRYYDPVVACFITKDSYEGDISNPLSINQYSYVYNNPLIYIDQSGHYVDYASEAARMNISQTGAWKDTVDQRLTSIGVNYMGGITDLDQIVGILQTVPTTNGNNSSNEAIASQPSPINNTNPDSASIAAKPTTAAQEIKKAENKVTANYGYYNEKYVSYGANDSSNIEDNRSGLEIVLTNPMILYRATKETLANKQNRNDAMSFIAETSGSVLVVNTGMNYCYNSFTTMGRNAGVLWPSKFVESLVTVGIGAAVLETYELIIDTQALVRSFGNNLKNHILKARGDI